MRLPIRRRRAHAARSRRAPPWSPRISSAAPPCSCWARRRCCSCRREGDRARVAVHAGGILCSARDGTRIVTGGDDGKVIATDADGASDRARDATPSTAGSIMSPSGPTARSPGRPASRRSCAARRATSGCSSCLRPSAGWRLRRRACGSRSPITTASRLWFPNAQARRRCWSGRARISA